VQGEQGGLRWGLAGMGGAAGGWICGIFPGGEAGGVRVEPGRLIRPPSPQEVGRMKIELFADVVPKTAENFR